MLKIKVNFIYKNGFGNNIRIIQYNPTQNSFYPYIDSEGREFNENGKYSPKSTGEDLVEEIGMFISKDTFEAITKLLFSEGVNCGENNIKKFMLYGHTLQSEDSIRENYKIALNKIYKVLKYKSIKEIFNESC